MFTLDDAFELLSDAVRHALIDAQDAGAAAFRESRLEVAQAMLDRARRLKAAESQLDALETELEALLPHPEKPELESPDDLTPLAPVYRRSRRGLKTPDAAYVRPILEALGELGGSAQAGEVLDLVYQKMKDQLNDHDRKPLPSDGITPRWRNAAQWVRFTLREQGLLQTDTPRGTWAISEHGRAWLSEH